MARQKQEAVAAMVSVTPTESFAGYPDGETEQAFKAGSPVDVPADYAALLREKNLIADPDANGSGSAPIAADTKPA